MLGSIFPMVALCSAVNAVSALHFLNPFYAHNCPCVGQLHLPVSPSAASLAVGKDAVAWK